MRISRRDKKKLRAIALCHTGNSECRKSRYSKEQWVEERLTYKRWLNIFSRDERKIANSIK